MLLADPVSNKLHSVETAAAHPSLGEATHTWARIGLLSFGGPAAQIALMHKVLVDEKKWLDEPHYLNALSFCMLLPGPEAMQLATYAGWRLHGVMGGLIAGLLFVLPGAAVVLALSMIYAAYGNVPLLQTIFLGIKAAVVVIVIEALLRIARRALIRPVHWAIAAVSFLAIFFGGVPFPVIVASAALTGALLSKGQSTPAASASATSGTALVPVRQTLATVAAWLVVWVAPLLGIAAMFGRDHVLAQLGWFFSKLSVVTFGGAYAALAYMGQDVADKHGWLSAGQMMDGLGLAETTPGPLILVAEFVGYLAAYQNGGAPASGPAWALGVLGAVVALWATFVPCFLWIFAGAPYLEWIIARPRLKGALTAITAAVVGVILNLAVWFALHVLFGRVDLVEAHGLKLWLPVWSSLDWRVLALTLVSGALLLWKHWSIGATLAAVSALALTLAYLIGGNIAG